MPLPSPSKQTRVRTISSMLECSAAPILTTTAPQVFQLPFDSPHGPCPDRKGAHAGDAPPPPYLPLKKKNPPSGQSLGTNPSEEVVAVSGMEHSSVLHGPLRNQPKKVTEEDCEVPRVTRSADCEGETSTDTAFTLL